MKTLELISILGHLITKIYNLALNTFDTTLLQVANSRENPSKI